MTEAYATPESTMNKTPLPAQNKCVINSMATMWKVRHDYNSTCHHQYN